MLPALSNDGGSHRPLATLELLVLLAQPPAARLAAASRVTLATPVRVTKYLIWLLSCSGYCRPFPPAA
jgi:hypothetical protein